MRSVSTKTGLLALALLLAVPELRAQVSRAPRVKAARAARGAEVEQLFTAKGLPYPAPVLFIRVFKRDAVLELWAGRRGEPLILVETFAICARSGELGPKRRRGDLQVPEGFYRINHFQPYSNFHLSMKVNYPNASDRVLGYRKNLGGDIFIHGDCVTIGCVPIEDAHIERLFLAVLDSHKAGQRHIPVHIFPTRLDAAGMAVLEQLAQDGAPHLDFWRGLKPGFEAFEASRKVPKIWVDKQGAYKVKPVD